MRSGSEIRAWAALGLGVLAFLAGLALARGTLLEWRLRELPDQPFFLERYRELAGRLGFRPSGPAPRIELATHVHNLQIMCEPMEDVGPGSTTGLGAGVCVEVAQNGTIAGDDQRRELAIFFSPQGAPRTVLWSLRSQVVIASELSRPVAPRPLQSAVIGLLLSPGQKLGPPRPAVFAGIPGAIYPLPGSSPEEYLYVSTYAGGSVFASLRPGDSAGGFATEAGTSFARILLRGIFPALFLGVVIVSFLTLLAKGRIDLVNGVVLAAVAFAAQAPDLWAHDFSPGGRLMKLAQIGLWSLWVFALWSAGESLLRACRPGSAATLDALRARKLGPRAGRALLLGVACGAALAGLRLAILAAASAIPGIWPETASLRLPVYDPWDNVVVYGLSLAGAVALVKAAAVQSRLPARWAPAAAALFVGLCANPVYLQPHTAEIVANFALAAILLAFLRKTDLTALLAASLTLVLLPTAVFAGLHLSWLPWTFLTSAGAVLALLALGAAGLRQPAHVESGRMRRPAFVRRIEEERRLRYEMDLLARMQEGLLPDALPEIPGWQIAARSILATEVGGDLYDFRFDREGRLWIAAGDVAGHGYSCAIVQAMTLAALGSFIAQGRSPAEVLQSVDPVIRRGTGSRNFTSLVLLRLDPATGEVVLSNAGHPFPLLAADGDVREIDLPGLPLGQGPSREYRDRTFYLPPGGVLVLYSDGLVEARDAHDVLYGFDRPQEVLRAVAHSPADRVLEILHADWRRHLGAEEPADDTTILVVKRVTAAAAPS